MTDREMIEFAAKAIGWRVASYSELGTSFVKGGTAVVVAEGKTFGWRPRTDDGDALRLAVKLGIAIYPPESEDDDAVASCPGSDAPWIIETRNDDPDAATRLAIVRAAAEIGKATP